MHTDEILRKFALSVFPVPELNELVAIIFDFLFYFSSRGVVGSTQNVAGIITIACSR
jgi:hypothetical protein